MRCVPGTTTVVVVPVAVMKSGEPSALIADQRSPHRERAGRGQRGRRVGDSQRRCGDVRVPALDDLGLALVAEHRDAGRLQREAAPPSGGKPHHRAPRMRRKWAWANSTTHRRSRRAARSPGRPGLPTSASDSPCVMSAVQIDQSGSAAAARPSSCPRTRRSPTRRGRRATAARSPSPASSHVRRARCSGLVNTVAPSHSGHRRRGSARAAGPAARRAGSSGMSVRPVCRYDAVHSVSP